MGSVVAYGYRMNERGRIVHRLFDYDDLRHGDAARNGWVDAPDKIEGHALAEANAAARRAENVGTTGREPKPTGEVYGEKPKAKPAKPASPKALPQKASGLKFIQTSKGQRAISTATGRFVKA